MRFRRQITIIQLLFLLIVLLSCNKDSDEPTALWEKVYGGNEWDCGWSVKLTPDGGFIIGGFTESFGAGGSDVWLVKVDSLGDTLWTRTFGGGTYDYGHSVISTSDNGYLVVGMVQSFGQGLSDIYLIKTDGNGNTIFERTYGGDHFDFGYSVEESSDGGLIIVGGTQSFGNGSMDVWLLKTDANGDTLWTRTIGGADYELGYSVQETDDGGFVITGISYNNDNGDVFLVKTTSDGDTVWTGTYGGEEEDCGQSVQQTPEGAYIITGYTGDYMAGQADILLMKVDSDGEFRWVRTYGGARTEYGNEVLVTSDGGYVVVGGITTDDEAGDVCLIKTDRDGNEQWRGIYGGDKHDWGYSVQEFNNTYIITGTTQSFAEPHGDLYILQVSHDE